MNLLGEPAYVGRHCGGQEYEISREVVDFYVEALEDRHPLYARWAPPLLHHSECYKYLGQWYLKNLFGNLHARQDWELFAPVPVGAQVRTRSTLVERYVKRGRDYVVNETDLLDAREGRLLVRGRTHQSFLPPDGPPATAEKERSYVVDAGTARKKARREPFPTAQGEELAPVAKRVDARRCWMFSGPGRNYHTDVEQAKKLGFPTIVVQGMMTTCFAAQVMLDRFGMGFLRGGRMSLKLTNVLWVDEEVTTRARIDRYEPEGAAQRAHCQVWAEKGDGARVLVGEASALDRDPLA